MILAAKARAGDCRSCKHAFGNLAQGCHPLGIFEAARPRITSLPRHFLGSRRYWFTFSNGSVFRSPRTNIGSALASKLLNESPPLAPVRLPHLVKGRQRFPRYLPATANDRAAEFHVSPSLTLTQNRILVSAPRDSKAGGLPGDTLHHSTDYPEQIQDNGSIVFHTATSRAAVTRLSYTVTPGFPRCRRGQISPPRPPPFLVSMTAYVCGMRPTLSILAAGRTLNTDFRRATGFNAHFLDVARVRVAQAREGLDLAMPWIGSK